MTCEASVWPTCHPRRTRSLCGSVERGQHVHTEALSTASHLDNVRRRADSRGNSTLMSRHEWLPGEVHVITYRSETGSGVKIDIVLEVPGVQELSLDEVVSATERQHADKSRTTTEVQLTMPAD